VFFVGGGGGGGGGMVPFCVVLKAPVSEPSAVKTK
jgi:hypothetical protein